MLIRDNSTAGKGTSKGKTLKQGPCSSNGKRAKRSQWMERGNKKAGGCGGGYFEDKDFDFLWVKCEALEGERSNVIRAKSRKDHSGWCAENQLKAGEGGSRALIQGRGNGGFCQGEEQKGDANLWDSRYTLQNGVRGAWWLSWLGACLWLRSWSSTMSGSPLSGELASPPLSSCCSPCSLLLSSK